MARRAGTYAASSAVAPSATTVNPKLAESAGDTSNSIAVITRVTTNAPPNSERQSRSRHQHRFTRDGTADNERQPVCSLLGSLFRR